MSRWHSSVSRATIVGIGAGLALALGSGCIMPESSIGESYTTIALTNTLSLVRDDEPVLIPLSEIRSRFKGFDERDFSVHLLPTNWYPDHGDPMLATSPAPEIPAQAIDSDLDGSIDSLLVICDFGAGERRYVAVASPHFSRFAKQIGPRVDGGLFVRETVTRESGKIKSQGKYVEVGNEVLDQAHSKGDGLYQCGGPIFETDANAWRLLFDSRMCLDVLGKRERGLVLQSNNKAFVGDALDLDATTWGGTLIGDGEGFGAGAFGYGEKGTVVPLSGFEAAQFRMVKDGPAATIAEVLLLGAKLGRESYDLRWRITQYAGGRVLRHDVSTSRGGHGLGFAINAGAARTELPSGRLGWMRVASFGPQNVTSDRGGQLGVAILANGRTAGGFVKNPTDVIGVQFDSSVRNVTFYTLAAWDQEPAGLRSAQDFQKEVDGLAHRIETPIKIANMEKDVRN